MVQSCHLCPYLKFCIVASLGETNLKNFSASLLRYTVKGKGRAIVNAGQPITGAYFLCEGSVKLTRTEETGGEVILGILDPFSLIGELPGAKQERHAFSALAVTELVEVAYLKSDVFFSLMRADPALPVGLAFHLSKRLTRAFRTLAQMKLPVEQRVILMMSRMVRRQRKRGAGTGLLIDLSHRGFAELVQTTPETLSRTFRSLQERGIIHLEKGKLRILKEEVLKRVFEELCQKNGWI